ncbi:hypothetical protein ABZ312_23760 [Streptomyces sp. NPDC006207]
MRVSECLISVRVVDQLIHYPSEVWSYELGEVDATGDDIAEYLHSIATLDGHKEYPTSNVVSIQESRTNWGASGSFAEYAITLASDITGGAGAVAFAAAVRTAFERIKTRSRPDAPSAEITAEEAQEILRRHIVRNYDIDNESLQEISSASSPISGTFEFSFLAPDGTEYGGIVSPVDGLPGCTKVWRKSTTPRLRQEFRYLSQEAEEE